MAGPNFFPNTFKVLQVYIFKPREFFSSNQEWKEYFNQFYTGNFIEDFPVAITKAIEFAFSYSKVFAGGWADLKCRLYCTRFLYFIPIFNFDLPVMDFKISKISHYNFGDNKRRLVFAHVERDFFETEILGREGDDLFLIEILFRIETTIHLNECRSQ